MGRFASWSLGVGLAVSVALAGGSRSWTPAAELAAGELEGVALDAEHRLRLGPARRELWGPEPGVLWDVRAARGGAWVALSGPARVIFVRADGEAVPWHEGTEDALITAVVPWNRGAIAARLPGAELLKLEAPGRSERWVALEHGQVWDLEADGDGGLWVAAADPGALLHVSRQGQARVVHETGDDPLRSLVALPDGGVVAGTARRGLVMRFTEGRPFVLLDAPEQEIVALAAGPDGTIYAAATGGTPSPPGRKSAPGVDRVTVKADAEPDDAPPDDSSAEKPAAKKRDPGVRGGAVYRIAADGSSRKIWSSARDVPLALAVDAGGLIVATGRSGRLFRIGPAGEEHRLSDFPSEHVAALDVEPGGRLWIGGTQDARLAASGPGLNESGAFVSSPFDAGAVSRWGALSVEATVPRGGSLSLSARAGNTKEPDATWSEWRVLENGHADASGIPTSRFFQFRLTLNRGTAGASPVVDRVALHFAPRNRPPNVTLVSVEPAGLAWTELPRQSQAQRGPVVIDDPVVREAAARVAAPPRRAVRKSFEAGVRTVTWEAADPDDDRLTYSLELRREGPGHRWFPLAEGIGSTFLSWDSRALPDGSYRVRLTAADSPANPEGSAFEVRKTSAPFRIDHTPPRIDGLQTERRGSGVRLTFRAVDPSGGRVAAAEWAPDGRAWQPIAPVDGVADSPEERFALDLDGSVERVYVRVVDEAGNVGGQMSAF